MADITDANQFIPDDAPIVAASDPAGALSALAKTQGSSRPFGVDSQRRFQESMEGRIRSPEQLAAARDERRGALEEFQKANSAPMNNMTGLDYIVKGMMNNRNLNDITYGYTQGVSDAYDADLARQELTRKSNIENAAAKRSFLKDEETIADKVEQTAMNNTGKIMATKMKNGGFLNTPRGLVKVDDVDPNTGEPKLVLPSAIASKMAQTALDEARKMVDSKMATNELNFSDQPDPTAARNEYIRQEADKNLRPQMELMGIHPGVSGDLIREYMPLSQAERNKVEGVKPKGFPMNKNVQPEKAPEGGWQIPKDVQGSRDTERLRILNEELAKTTNPADREAIQREIANTQKGAAPVATIKPFSMPRGTIETGQKAIQGIQKTGGEENDMVQKMAKDGQLTLALTQDIEHMPHDDTGMLANMKKNAGAWAAAFGISPDLIEKADNLSNLNTQLERHVASQLYAMKGAASQEDVERYRSMLPSIKDTAARFKYNLEHARELAMRQMEQGSFYDKYAQGRLNDPTARQTPYMGARDAYQQRLNELGPVSRNVVTAEGKRVNYFRSKAEADALAKYPNADPAKVKAAFAKAWVNNPEQFGERSK